MGFLGVSRFSAARDRGTAAHTGPSAWTAPHDASARCGAYARSAAFWALLRARVLKGKYALHHDKADVFSGSELPAGSGGLASADWCTKVPANAPKHVPTRAMRRCAGPARRSCVRCRWTYPTLIRCASQALGGRVGPVRRRRCRIASPARTGYERPVSWRLIEPTGCSPWPGHRCRRCAQSPDSLGGVPRAVLRTSSLGRRSATIAGPAIWWVPRASVLAARWPHRLRSRVAAVKV